MTNSTKIRKPKPRVCANCGSPALYAGGLCRPCASSFGTWGVR